jgi:DNA-binding response OmpR family regulator
MNDFFANSKLFNLIVIKDFLSKDQKIKINDEDILLFFNSGEGIAGEFMKYLSDEGFKNTYIIFNSNKDEKGLEKNRAIYLTIPISFNELTQSLQNILIQKETIEYHDIRLKKLFLNMTGRSLRDSKISIKLTDKEAKIIWHLIKEKSSVVNQSFLLNKVWGYKEDIETKTLTTHIYTIRKKAKNFSDIFSIENSVAGYYIKFK